MDFSYHQIVDIYKDANAYFIDKGWMKVDRPNQRRPDGNIESMMKDENRYELVVGDKSRSGGQWDIWEATYSPVGADGYPKRIWNKTTGEIDKSVAEAWRKYDLRHILETNWATLGPKVANKLNVYVGDMDSYYLNDARREAERVSRQGRQPEVHRRDRVPAARPALLGPAGRGADDEDDGADREVRAGRGGFEGVEVLTEPVSLHKPRERDVEHARLAVAAVPLDEDGTLVGAFDDRPAIALAVRHEQADRSLHAQEPRGRHRDRAREHSLDHRLVETDRIDQLVEDAHEVVFRVVERPGRNRARVARACAPPSRT